MKRETKAKILIGVMTLVTLAPLPLFLLACDPEPKPQQQEQAKDQSATLTDLFGEGYSTTVTGHLTDTQWAGVAGKIEDALNGAFDASGNSTKNRFRNVFGTGDAVTIIVGNRPTGDFTYETVGDGATLYLNINALNNADLQSKITAAITAMNSFESTTAQILPTHDKGWKQVKGHAVRMANAKRIASRVNAERSEVATMLASA